MKLTYFIVPIVVVIVAILTPFLIKGIKKANSKKEVEMTIDNFEIRYLTTYPIIVLIISVILWIAVLLILTLYPPAILVFIALIPLAILFTIATYIMFRFKIIINKDELKYRPIFGKTKKIKIDQITKIEIKDKQNGTSSTKVYTDKKIFTITNELVGYQIFIKKARLANINIVFM